MKASDLLWLLAYPVYQIIGTARHELSHALGAVIQGGEVLDMAIVPSYSETSGLRWGWVTVTNVSSWTLVSVAPYGVGLILALCTLLILKKTRLPRWVRLNCVILGVLSPLLDLAYNYAKLFWTRHGDLPEVAHHWPSLLVHSACPVALSLLLGASALSLRTLKTTPPAPPPQA